MGANAGGAPGYIGVMRPNNNGEYVEMKKKMESLEEKLKEKDEDFEGLQDSYQALLVKERNNNDQLQDARKKLINVSCLLVVIHFNLDFIVNESEFFHVLLE